MDWTPTQPLLHKVTIYFSLKRYFCPIIFIKFFYFVCMWSVDAEQSYHSNLFMLKKISWERNGPLICAELTSEGDKKRWIYVGAGGKRGTWQIKVRISLSVPIVSLSVGVVHRDDQMDQTCDGGTPFRRSGCNLMEYNYFRIMQVFFL